MRCCATSSHALFLKVLRPQNSSRTSAEPLAGVKQVRALGSGQVPPPEVAKSCKRPQTTVASARIPDPAASDGSRMLECRADCCVFTWSVSVRQVPDGQRVDPLGSWMDFVKRPVGNFPAKCRKRKRPLVKKRTRQKRAEKRAERQEVSQTFKIKAQNSNQKVAVVKIWLLPPTHSRHSNRK